MKQNENLFVLKTRREIYNFILKYPGLHLRDISKKLQMNHNTIDYHVKFLEKRGLIEIKNEDGYSRCYSIKRNGKREKILFKIMRQTVPRNIILFLFVNTADIFSPKELKKAPEHWTDKNTDKILPHLQKHTTTLIYHLNKLEELDIVERINVGKEVKYRLKNPAEIIDFFITFQHSLFDDTVQFVINLMNNSESWKDMMSGTCEKIFEIFPHPYHV